MLHLEVVCTTDDGLTHMTFMGKRHTQTMDFPRVRIQVTRSFAFNQKNAAATVATLPATNPDQILLALLNRTSQF